MSLLNKTLIGLGSTLAILGIPAYYYVQSNKQQKQMELKHINKDPYALSGIELQKIPNLQLVTKNYVCQLYPTLNSKLHGKVQIHQNNRVSFDLSDTLPQEQSLFLSVYEFGGIILDKIDLTAGKNSIGRKIMTLGQLSNNNKQFRQQIQKQIIGRSLVIQNEEKQIFAAGIIALE